MTGKCFNKVCCDGRPGSHYKSGCRQILINLRKCHEIVVHKKSSLGILCKNTAILTNALRKPERIYTRILMDIYILVFNFLNF